MSSQLLGQLAAVFADGALDVSVLCVVFSACLLARSLACWFSIAARLAHQRDDVPAGIPSDCISCY